MRNETKTISILSALVIVLASILIYTGTRSLGYKEQYNTITEHYNEARADVIDLSKSIGKATEIVTTITDLQQELSEYQSANKELIREREATNKRLERLTVIAGSLNSAVEDELGNALDGITEVQRQITALGG